MEAARNSEKVSTSAGSAAIFPSLLYLIPVRPESVSPVTGHLIIAHLPLLCFCSQVVHTRSIFTWQGTFAAVDHRCTHLAEYHASSLPLSWRCVARNCNVLYQSALFLPFSVCCLSLRCSHGNRVGLSGNCFLHNRRICEEPHMRRSNRGGIIDAYFHWITWIFIFSRCLLIMENFMCIYNITKQCVWNYESSFVKKSIFLPSVFGLWTYVPLGKIFRFFNH